MVTAAELFSLWHGDEEVTGFAHPELVVAVCTLKRPPNQQSCRLLFYSAADLADVPEDVLMIVDEGFRLWRLRENDRHRLAA